MKKTYGDLSIDLSKVLAFWVTSGFSMHNDWKELHVLISSSKEGGPFELKRTLASRQASHIDPGTTELYRDLQEFWRNNP